MVSVANPRYCHYALALLEGQPDSESEIKGNPCLAQRRDGVMNHILGPASPHRTVSAENELAARNNPNRPRLAKGRVGHACKQDVRVVKWTTRNWRYRCRIPPKNNTLLGTRRNGSTVDYCGFAPFVDIARRFKDSVDKVGQTRQKLHQLLENLVEELAELQKLCQEVTLVSPNSNSPPSPY
ncbi:hypothetical protein BDN71DRAFT_594046 [Pleurotus eryngii]|uniref:Uncharacterized protein n=1 Tax=Pleurotus eryngii TaxID=5323 RepID=A0A9P5ZZT8_PLEER|nr:hypothetical protein BDN71DRAFT_594046 [Pleurotus eryngii]